MARVGLYTYEKEKDLEIFLLCEILRDGIWEQVENHPVYAENTDHLEVFYPFHCEPNSFHRVRAFCMINNRACMDRVTQRELLQVTGIWNVWGRDDDMNEPKSVPLEEFNDDVPMASVEERKLFPKDARVTKYKKRK